MYATLCYGCTQHTLPGLPLSLVKGHRLLYRSGLRDDQATLASSTASEAFSWEETSSMAELSWAILSARSCTMHINISQSVDLYHTTCAGAHQERYLIGGRTQSPWPCCIKQPNIFHMLGRMESAPLQKVIKILHTCGGKILCKH